MKICILSRFSSLTIITFLLLVLSLEKTQAGSKCNLTSQCLVNQACDPIFHTCLKVNGQPCSSNLGECVNNLECIAKTCQCHVSFNWN